MEVTSPHIRSSVTYIHVTPLVATTDGAQIHSKRKGDATELEEADLALVSPKQVT